VLLAEYLKLLIRDLERPSVADGFGDLAVLVNRAAVLARLDQDLKALPSRRRDLGNGGHHVLVEIVAADDGVHLEEDVVLLAPQRDLLETLDVVAVASADALVCVFVKRVAGHSHDVDIFAVGLEPGFVYDGAIGHDGDGFELEDSLAELAEVAEVLLVQKRFATSKVDLLHASFFKENETALGFVDGEDV